MKTYKFNNSKIRIEKCQYPNGRTALEFIDASDGEPYLVATVNIPEIILQPGEICIKNWSENEGVLEFLITKGIISRAKRTFHVGFGVPVHVVDLLTEDF